MGSKKESEDLFMRKSMKKVAAAILSAAMVVSMAACGADSGEQTGGSDGGDSVKVGLLHSMSGSMAISEKAVLDAEKLAISEINEAGGVLGKQITYQEEDGASDPSTFATKAENRMVSQQYLDAGPPLQEKR